jgi:peroxiredoxin Q/BCP
VTSHLKFKSKFNLPFILLSDNDKKLRKLFGVQNSLFIIPGRETFVIDKQGVVIMVFNSMSSEIHITKALKVLKKLTN